MAKSKSVEHTHKDGTKHSHVDGDKEHEHEITSAVVKLKEGDVAVYTKEKVVAKHGIVWIDKVGAEIVEEKKKPTNVYSADYKLIDDTIEEIKKASRKVSTNDYSTNNVYLLLQDALKKVILAEK